MLLNTLIIITTSILSFIALGKPEIINKLIFEPVSVNRNREYYRFITAGFLHADINHLVFNMITLYFFGEQIEIIFIAKFGIATGKLYYLLFYLLGIIVSVIPSYLKNRNNSTYRCLGASGGVSAIVFAFILFLPMEDVCLYFFLCLKGFFFGLIYLSYSMYYSRKNIGNINHDAHLYGAVFGVIYILIFFPDSGINFIEQIKEWLIVKGWV